MNGLYLTDDGKNALLDSSADLPPSHMSLHTAYPSTSGTNEVSGGSPAYARQASAWDAASSGTKALSADETFDVPGSTDVAWIGLWTAASGGTFLGAIPAKGDLSSSAAEAKTFVMEDETTDVFDSIAHGFSDGDTVVVQATDGSLPTGVAEGTVYYVISSSTNTFQLSATSGGSSVALTGKGQGLVERIVVETFASQGTATVSASSTNLSIE